MIALMGWVFRLDDHCATAFSTIRLEMSRSLRSGAGAGRGQVGAGWAGRPVASSPSAIIAALDANYDGVIDETEIAMRHAALPRWTKNGDGKLNIEELLRRHRAAKDVASWWRPPPADGAGQRVIQLDLREDFRSGAGASLPLSASDSFTLTIQRFTDSAIHRSASNPYHNLSGRRLSTHTAGCRGPP